MARQVWTGQCFGGPYDGQTWQKDTPTWEVELIEKGKWAGPKDVIGTYFWNVSRGIWQWRQRVR